MEAESWQRWGVAVVWRAAKECQVEITVRFVPNVVSLLLTSGLRRWYFVGSYVPPNDAPDVHRVDKALQAVPKGLEMILMGYLNTWLVDSHDEHEEDLGDGASRPWSGKHDRTFLAQETLPGSRQLDVENEEGRAVVDGDGGLHPLHIYDHIYQRGAA